MAAFEYKAANDKGELVEGRLDALDQKSAIKKLQGEKLTPIRVSEAGAGLAAGSGGLLQLPALSLGRGRVSGSELSVFTLELSTLLEANLPLDQALELMARLSGSGSLHDVIVRIHAAVRRGSDLSSALEAEGSLFSRFYMNIVKAGEASGALEIALARLVDFMERSRAMRATLTSAMLYPIILLLFAGVSLALILGVVIPKISQMFADAGQQLPLATRIVVNGGELVHTYWWLAAAGLIAGYAVVKVKADDEAWRQQWDSRFLRLPVFGELLGKYEAARFTRTLGTLLDSGVPLLEAIAIARQAVGNRIIAAGLDRVAASVRAGQGIARPLLESDVFPKLAGHLMQVGEQTGNLQAMLLRLADIYDREVQTTLKRLVDVLGPLLILGIGLLIGGIIMSVMTAILSVNELAF
ncbi:MAG: type II secretion system F family protein [Pseudomonadota bacterium]